MTSLGENHFSCRNMTEVITEKLVAANEHFFGKQQGVATEIKDNTCNYHRSGLSEQLNNLFLSILKKGKY